MKENGTILITGASGFVGRHVIAALEAAGHPRSSMASLLAAGSVEAPAGTTPIVADIADRAAITDAIDAIKPRVIVHLAAIAEPARARADSDRAWAVNLDGTRHIAEALLNRAPSARMIFVSSSEVYGRSFNEVGGPITEDAALKPMNVYAATKAAADIMLGQLAEDGLDVIRFRSFNHTGPGQAESYVAPAFARQVAEIERGLQQPVVSVGNLDAKRDFLDVRDVARAYALAVNAEIRSPNDRVMNLASGTPRRIQAVLDHFAGASSVDVEVQPDPARLRPSEVPLTCGDASRAARVLGWAPEIAFDATLDDVLEDWRVRVSRGEHRDAGAVSGETD